MLEVMRMSIFDLFLTWRESIQSFTIMYDSECDFVYAFYQVKDISFYPYFGILNWLVPFLFCWDYHMDFSVLFCNMVNYTD